MRNRTLALALVFAAKKERRLFNAWVEESLDSEECVPFSDELKKRARQESTFLKAVLKRMGQEADGKKA